MASTGQMVALQVGLAPGVLVTYDCAFQTVALPSFKPAAPHPTPHHTTPPHTTPAHVSAAAWNEWEAAMWEEHGFASMAVDLSVKFGVQPAPVIHPA